MTSGFNKDNFQHLYDYEDKSFWFRMRNKIILWSFKKYLKKFDQYLEVGCGTGYVTRAICSAYPNVNITATEYFDEAIEYAKNRIPNASFIKADGRQLNLNNAADAVGLFDVLEHINEDINVLKQICAALKSNGLLFMTVPQHQWLWSYQDEMACHVRRYDQKDLHFKLRTSGFEIVRSTSFVTVLLPLMIISRVFKHRHLKHQYAQSASSELQLSSFMNNLFYFLMSIDYYLIRLGVNLPLGGSRLIIARKI